MWHVCAYGLCVFLCVWGMVCMHRWCVYMCVHLQETNTPDSTDFQVSAERGSSQFLKVDEQRKLMLL